MRLEELGFKAADVVARSTAGLAPSCPSHQASFVLTACCEIFAAVGRERLRTLADGDLDLTGLLRAGV